MMRHHSHHERASPVLLALLTIPLLLTFGVMKGCQAVRLAIEPEAAAPATVQTKPPTFIIEAPEKGWHI